MEDMYKRRHIIREMLPVVADKLSGANEKLKIGALMPIVSAILLLQETIEPIAARIIELQAEDDEPSADTARLDYIYRQIEGLLDCSTPSIATLPWNREATDEAIAGDAAELEQDDE